MRTVLCTAGDKNYFQTSVFEKCLKSYAKETSLEKYVFLVDEEDCDVNTQGIQKIFINWKEINSKNTNKCIQHGEFARYLDFLDDDDKIIFTDGDILLQREFNQEELNLVQNLKENTFLANFNLHQNSNMLEVLFHLGCQPSQAQDFVQTNFSTSQSDLLFFKEMNTGVLVGSKKDFISLSEIYAQHYDELKKIVPGFWNQQFLINMVINKFFNYHPIGYEIHGHIHHSIPTITGCVPDIKRNMGVPSPITQKEGKYMINDKVILFAHKFHK